MLIDWFTVGAQIVNFLILVLLLKKFLYGPIVKVMAAREAKIQAQLAEAETGRRQAAAAEEPWPSSIFRNWRINARPWLPRSRPKWPSRKPGLLDAARQEVGQYRQGWLQSLSREKAAIAQTIQNSCSLQAFTLARAIIRELGDVSRGRTLSSRYFWPNCSSCPLVRSKPFGPPCLNPAMPPSLPAPFP